MAGAHQRVLKPAGGHGPGHGPGRRTGISVSGLQVLETLHNRFLALKFPKNHCLSETDRREAGKDVDVALPVVYRSLNSGTARGRCIFHTSAGASVRQKLPVFCHLV